jgi:OFA family oxalate/formate antiporter-like MFS transporter
MVPNSNRWWIAAMGTLLQMCLGSVYAWSYFQKPLVEAGGWRHTQVAWTFSLAIAFLGAAAAVGGLCLPRFGPRKLAILGSVLFGAGHLLAALALWWRVLPLLWLGYGAIGGIGLGLGYVTPVATVAKWFPDRKGLVTGMVVMGFGFGALLMSKVIAPALDTLFQHQLPLVFAGAGVIVGGVGLAAAVFLRNPPEAAPGPTAATGPETGARDLICSRQFVLMWLVFFCNITAGIALIGFQSPLLQDLWAQADPTRSPAALASAGATLIAASSVCNGLGRILWGALSDRIGQLLAFRVMLATQIVAFAALMVTSDPWLFGVLVCYVLLCYGGGFGLMPAFISNTYGPRLMPALYGTILTAWSCAGIVGPQIIAQLKDRTEVNLAVTAFGLCVVLLALGLGLSLILQRPSSGVRAV